jgi:hypothetical protein
MKIKVGEKIDLQADKRYIQHVRSHTIGDVYDALVELITNADDSYSRLFMKQKRNRNGGDILIEYLEQRKGSSIIIVRDKAEGMNSEDMEKCLLKIGAYSSESGNRGYMGRGAKDCTELGSLTFESIKDDRYYRCRITYDLKFILEENGSAVTKELRKHLGIEHGNGTSVALELNQEIRLPRFQNLAVDLPWHFALRDIMSEDSDSRVLLRKMGDHDASPERLVFRPPEGEIVVDETFDVEGYSVARAKLRVWKAPELLEQYKDRFERFGIIIKGKRAIHECSMLSDEFKKDPHAQHYFGRLDCDYIDQLMMEYEEYRAKGLSYPLTNPRLLVDPNRRYGLERHHPFVQSLLQIPIERIRALLAKDREQDKTRRQEVANKETRTRLSRLAKLAGQFLRQQLDELEELGGGDAVDDQSFKQGVLIYPTYLKLGVGKERTLTYYVKRSLLKNNSEPVMIEADSKGALEIVGSPFLVHSHRTKEDRLLGFFKLRGLKAWAGNTIVITARCNGLPPVEALVQVVEDTIEERVFNSPLEFEREEYNVRLGSRKGLRLFAKSPEIIAEEAEVQVSSEEHARVAIKGRCLLVPVAGSNYATGIITVEGRTLKSKSNITAEINGRKATTIVKVIEKPEEDRNIPIEIQIRDEDYGNFRARWADHEGKPNLLLISARHKSLARYLGPAEQKFPGQVAPWFRVILAEIVAESVCRKSLVMESKERPWEFAWTDLKEPYVIADDVLAKMQKRLRDFVADAHSIMLSDNDIQTISEIGSN